MRYSDVLLERAVVQVCLLAAHHDALVLEPCFLDRLSVLFKSYLVFVDLGVLLEVGARREGLAAVLTNIRTIAGVQALVTD